MRIAEAVRRHNERIAGGLSTRSSRHYRSQPSDARPYYFRRVSLHHLPPPLLRRALSTESTEPLMTPLSTRLRIWQYADVHEVSEDDVAQGDGTAQGCVWHIKHLGSF
jgi:hypothetical protein